MYRSFHLSVPLHSAPCNKSFPITWFEGYSQRLYRLYNLWLFRETAVDSYQQETDK